VDEPPSIWQVAAASVAGTSHLATGLPCQDAHAWQLCADGTLLAACADGAGSAARSGEGARLVVDAALAALVESLAELSPDSAEAWAELLRAVFEAARGALVVLAEAEVEALRAFSTTLSVVAVNDSWLAAGHNGDGFVVVQQAGALRLLAAPARGEFANEVAFLTAPDGLDHVTVLAESADEVTGLVLSTDGLLRLALALPAAVPHAGFIEPLLGFAREAGRPEDGSTASAHLADWLASAAVNARTDDDKTLVLAVRPAAAE
jgi:serine/threonine protein phosphatase PrpC